MNELDKQFLVTLSKIYKETYHGRDFTSFKSYVKKIIEENEEFIKSDLYSNTLKSASALFSSTYRIFNDENFEQFKKKTDELLNNHQDIFLSPSDGRRKSRKSKSHKKKSRRKSEKKY